MELFYENNGHKYRVLSVDKLGRPDAVDELEDAQFEDLPAEESGTSESKEDQQIDLTI